MLHPECIANSQKAEKYLGGLKQDTSGQASAKDISSALEHESIIKHKDEVSFALDFDFLHLA